MSSSKEKPFGSDKSPATSASNRLDEEPTELREHLLKILVIGELATGKTSFIRRFVHQYFNAGYRATIGVDFALKVINWDAHNLIRLQLWDIAGQERFGNMTRVYYKEAVGAFVVFDVSRPSTLDAVIKWKQDLDEKVTLADGSPIPVVLLANKSDLTKQGASAESPELDTFCVEHRIDGWFYTSPKENTNIDRAARFLIEKILEAQHHLSVTESEHDAIRMRDAEQLIQDRSKRCSC